jgi:hypothetical protein
MNELFCPQHGLPAMILWCVLGNPQIFLLTVRMYYGKFKNMKGSL